VKKFSLITRYNFDLALFFSTLFLVIIGVLFIYSAGSHDESISFVYKPYFKQLIFILPGGILFALLLHVNYLRLSNYWIIFYVISLIFLVLVLVLPSNFPIISSKEINGAKSWISIGNWLVFQPSELIKILFIVILARFLDKDKPIIIKFKTRFISVLNGNFDIQKIRFLLLIFSLPLPIIGFVMLQPDPGTALVYIPITLFMLLIGGAKIKHILIVIFIGVVSLTSILIPSHYVKESEKYIQKDQIETMINEYSVYSYILQKKDIENLKNTSLYTIDNTSSSAKNLFKSKLTIIKNNFAYFTLKIALVCFGIMILFYFLFKLIIKLPIIYYFSVVFFVLSFGILSSAVGQIVLKPHHTARILAICDRNKDLQGINYNQNQSIIAIGSGGILGHGLGNGPQNRLKFIPERTTDFIFPVIGEEWGFLRGTLLILILFSIIIYRGLMISYHSKDHFGTLLATGITVMLFSHIFINLAMCTGFWPVMGLPLPFLSAGGSSLLTNLAGVALLLNISHKRFIH